jgi:hypothetical protein
MTARSGRKVVSRVAVSRDARPTYALLSGSLLLLLALLLLP